MLEGLSTPGTTSRLVVEPPEYMQHAGGSVARGAPHWTLLARHLLAGLGSGGGSSPRR